ncbi:MAG: GntR family transcriptional regulator [Rhodobacteraceae bacterium]|nr:GntR family transcriptional regulator [Paracoccaceae bacterium]
MNLIAKPDSDPANPGVKPPAHEQVYRKLREQILFGEMAPGQAVTIQGLTQALNAGMTPVREAIRRLTSDGALVFQGNRRVSVPQLTTSDVEQLVYLRKTMESELTLRAAKRMGKTEITHLDQLDHRLDRAISAGDVVGYLTNNYLFHAYLYEQAQAPVLADLVNRVWLRFGPSLRVVCGRFGTQNLADHHKEVLEALQSGNPDAAALAIVRDVEQGMQQVKTVLTAD